ncbi:MAG: tetratricopeptide repeat protein [Myxococcales bacterium]|nr:tetratricopeptide repeat protein [Myxococcales bacterium]
MQARELPVRAVETHAELADRVLIELHLAVCDAEVVARLVVVSGECRADALLEVGEDRLEAVVDRGQPARGELGRGIVVVIEDAAKLEPTDAELANLVGVCALNVADLKKATEYTERAISLEENNPSFRKTRARIYRAANQPEEARRQFQRAWELDPLDEEVKAELARR